MVARAHFAECSEGDFWNRFDNQKRGGWWGGKPRYLQAGWKPSPLFPIHFHFARDGGRRRKKNRMMALGSFRPSPPAPWATGTHICTLYTYIMRDFSDRWGRLRISILHLIEGSSIGFGFVEIQVTEDKRIVISGTWRGYYVYPFYDKFC